MVDPLVLRPSETLCSQLWEAGYTLHKVKRDWPPKTAQTRNCSFLAALIAENFASAPTHSWRVTHETEFYRGKEQ